MIGVYDYTVILTYLSLLSAGTGIVVSLSDRGHPFIGMFFLLFCGLCDAFDGKVARSKSDRTDLERKFGIQIDSLADVISFGVLPACIGVALLRTSTVFESVLNGSLPRSVHIAITGFTYGAIILFILAAVIRLAYFNVTEEKRQEEEGGNRKYYLGLPVTSAAIIFPSVLILIFIFKRFLSLDLSLMYIFAIITTGALFISPIKVRKPGLRGILIMVGIGVAECLLMLILLQFVVKR